MPSLPKLFLKNNKFVDCHDRQVILRGVNLGGDCKLPYPDGATHKPTDFSDNSDVSFIGRPFPLEEAKQHFKRLQHWGFNCLRLLTSWEAIEHKGPGIFDEEYLDFFTRLIEMAGEYGFYVYVDFHQDVWSRMSGGDGAPCWTFEKAGIDYRTLDESDAAFVMQQRYNFNDPRPRQNDNYPQMSWFHNYNRAANGIMWTLFFGGRDFAPDFKVDGLNIQDYLQSHFIGSQLSLAKRISHFPHVLGFDILNEPNGGWIGKSLTYRPTKENPDHPEAIVMPGLAWSPLDALKTSHGETLQLPELGVSFFTFKIVPKSNKTVNPDGISIWIDPEKDPFLVAGAYEKSPEGLLIKPKEEFFSVINNKKISFSHDYLGPFFHRAMKALRAENPDWFLFAEPDLLNMDTTKAFPDSMPENTVNAGHCYDVTTLLFKKFFYPLGVNLLEGKFRIGRKGFQADYEKQFNKVVEQSQKINNGCPTLIGEFGIPYDLNNGKAYKLHALGDHSDKPWKAHINALDLMYNALDALQLSSTQWNYTASNSNDLKKGDGWNQEDLSIFSLDQQTDPEDIDSGGRAIEGFVRPYARFTQGQINTIRYDRTTRMFTLEFEADTAIKQATEIFVPSLVFPEDYQVIGEGFEYEKSSNHQSLCITAKQNGYIKLILRA